MLIHNSNPLLMKLEIFQKTKIVCGFMPWSWGWELHPMQIEISPSKLLFFYIWQLTNIRMVNVYLTNQKENSTKQL